MKKVLKYAGAALLVVVALLVGAVSFLTWRKPASRPATAEKFEATPVRLARGEYLVRHVTDCLGCHSDHVDDRYGFPVKPGTEGKGGLVFSKMSDEDLGAIYDFLRTVKPVENKVNSFPDAKG
ncbi:MAG: cytochrome c-related protein [Acidobacteria bacterium]|nr:cytochrome c-related protein [Acidobacteriota bacterium]